MIDPIAEAIALIERDRPDLIVVPREANKFMVMRGHQAEIPWMTYQGKPCDFVMDRLNMEEAPEVVGYSPSCRADSDDRGWIVVAAAWRGCIAGLVEWKTSKWRGTGWDDSVVVPPDCVKEIATA